MHWNHRVVRRKYEYNDGKYVEYCYAIHEVYYDEDGKPDTMTKEPTDPHGESIKDLKWSLKKMKECLEHPVLDYETMEEIEGV